MSAAFAELKNSVISIREDLAPGGPKFPVPNISPQTPKLSRSGSLPLGWLQKFAGGPLIAKYGTCGSGPKPHFAVRRVGREVGFGCQVENSSSSETGCRRSHSFLGDSCEFP